MRAIALGLLVHCFAAWAGEAQHPFMLWTKDEAARIRKLIETEAWAKAAYARETDNLVKYGILGDRAAGEAEKALLFKELGTGKLARTSACRYDVLYDLLSAEERARVRKDFTARVEQAMDSMSRQKHFTRWNWLPNLAYAWYSDLHAVAAATGDKDLIRKFFNGPNAIKWYLDEYLSDLGFYNEEFSKMFNTPQGLVAWCWAMERLGLDELGWGYRGRQGATVRGHIDSILRIGMPRVDMGLDRYFYPRLTIGDTRGGGHPGLGFQHAVVGLPKTTGPARFDWYRDLLEYAHAKWPEAGYGYFLVQMREPGESAYQMPLRFGVAPIEPGKVKPSPAPSGVYPGRGLVVLRAEEGPEYWESPAPAVGMRLATPYAHHVQDSFCLTGFYGFNRALFVNHAHATNYTGVDPGYSNSARSHSIVMVDRCEPDTLLDPVDIRQDLNPRVKFVAARAKGIFRGVDQTRALMLTKEYLFDLSHLVSDRPRDYLWQIQAIGNACPDSPSLWTPSADLLASLPDLGFEQSCATDKTWAVTVAQSSGGANRDFTVLGERWFKERIGVRTTVLGEPDTRAYVAWSPVVANTNGLWRGRSRFAFGEDEPAGTAIVATRKKAVTTFAAIHEPFKTTHRIKSVHRIWQDERGLGVEVCGDTFTDYLVVMFGDKAAEAVPIQAPGRTFSVANYAYIRVTRERVDVEGEVKALAVPVAPAAPKLYVHGREVAASLEDGFIRFGEASRKPTSLYDLAAADAMPKPALAARWHPPTGLCLPTGGQGAAALKLRNNTLEPVTAEVAIVVPKGLVASPATVALSDFAPGAEKDVTVSFDAAKAPANQLLEVTLSSPRLDIQRAPLKLANGVAFERAQVGSEFYQTIYAPRYVAKYWYMDSGAATELLDPLGYRRNDSAGSSYPSYVRSVTEGDRTRVTTVKVPKFPYFIPMFVSGGADAPKQLYEGGKHAHGTQSGVEHLFTEDWILVRDRNAAAGQEAAFDWLGERGGINSLERSIPGRDGGVAAEKMPGATFIFDGEGRKIEMPAAAKGKTAWPRDLKSVSAVFVRPDGYPYGSLMLYPKGSRFQNGYAYQPGDKAMGFTFCTDAELPALLKKWMDNTPTGEVDPSDAGRYRGAFGARPVKAE